MRLELGGAGVHGLEYRHDAELIPRLAHHLLGRREQLRKPAVRKTVLLGPSAADGRATASGRSRMTRLHSPQVLLHVRRSA